MNTDIHSADKISSGKNSDDTEVSADKHSFDYDAVWKAVFEDGEAAKGSFYIIGSGSMLTDIGEHEFTVTAGSEHVKKHAEKNRELLENLMEKHTGRRRAMRLELNGGNMTAGKNKTIEDVARQAESVLGIDVEIQ